MFHCAITNKVSEPGEPPIRVVVETRERTYDNHHPVTGEYLNTSRGTETVREVNMSPVGARDSFPNFTTRERMASARLDYQTDRALETQAAEMEMATFRP